MELDLVFWVLFSSAKIRMYAANKYLLIIYIVLYCTVLYCMICMYVCMYDYVFVQYIQLSMSFPLFHLFIYFIIHVDGLEKIKNKK